MNEILGFSFERKFRKDKLHFFEKIPPKSPSSLRLRKDDIFERKLIWDKPNEFITWIGCQAAPAE